MRLAAPLATVVLLLTTACETISPCTECPVVSGKFTVTWPLVPKEESTCGSMFVYARQSEVVLVQDGSALVVTDTTLGSSPLNLKGTLYDQFLVEFEPVSTMTNLGQGTRMTMSGVFSGEEGARILNGTMKLELEGEEPCKLNVPMVWTQAPVVPEQTL